MAPLLYVRFFTAIQLDSAKIGFPPYIVLCLTLPSGKTLIRSFYRFANLRLPEERRISWQLSLRTANNRFVRRNRKTGSDLFPVSCITCAS
jgi:hypothetical protein